jgi:hypothetical protein
MWFADILFDQEWFRSHPDHLGEPQARFRGHSESTGVDLTFLFYGDTVRPRHLRVLFDTDDKEKVDRCLSANVQTWVMSLEVAVSMQTGETVSVPRLPGAGMPFVVITGEVQDGDVAAQGVTISIERGSKSFVYEHLPLAFALWTAGLREHLFYFRRFVDDRSFLDQRWLAGYRLLEWHFVGRSGKDLPKMEEWRSFLGRFEAEFSPMLKPRQALHGLLEEVRALVAHAAALDERTYRELQNDRSNEIERTFPILERMVITALNEHPDRRPEIELRLRR